MLVDEIWHAAGDEASDIDWYVKRTVLGGIYSTTEIYMLTDSSPGLFPITFMLLEHWCVCIFVSSAPFQWRWKVLDSLSFTCHFFSGRVLWYMAVLGWSGERCFWFQEDDPRGISPSIPFFFLKKFLFFFFKKFFWSVLKYSMKWHYYRRNIWQKLLVLEWGVLCKDL